MRSVLHRHFGEDGRGAGLVDAHRRHSARARAEPHRHVGYETGLYVLEGRVLTRWGASLEHEVVSEPGDFLFVPPGVPHEAIHLSATEPARAVVARG